MQAACDDGRNRGRRERIEFRHRFVCRLLNFSERRSQLRSRATGEIGDAGQLHIKVFKEVLLIFRLADHAVNEAQARVLRTGRNFVVTECEIFDREGTLSAKALLTFADGELELAAYSPGESVESVCAATGWPLRVRPDVRETPAPSADELRLLRGPVHEKVGRVYRRYAAATA